MNAHAGNMVSSSAGTQVIDAPLTVDSRHVPTRAILEIEVTSDAICPWCWIGKRRLERALEELQPQLSSTVKWRPFSLNPGMPKEGVDRRAYRSRKFGSWEHSSMLDAQVASAGKAKGLVFRHDLIERTPNTFDAHRLIWLAAREGEQNALVERLFSAYLKEGLDIGSTEVLISIGSAAGLRADRVAMLFASNEGRKEVAAELSRNSGLAISSVPTVSVNGRPLFSGAIRHELMAARLRDAVSDAGR